jgi:hypothetical protein
MRVPEEAMIWAATGLTDVPTDDLKRALGAVHRGDLACPITPDTLACVGLQARSAHLLDVLRGLDERAVRAVLVAVIAERLPQNRKRRQHAEAGA